MAVLVALPLAALAQAPAAQTPTAPKAVAQTDAVEPGGDRGRAKRDKMERALRRFRTTT
jgi:hypothetical protein